MRVQSLLNFVENLTLTGSGNLSGTGNALANTLRGNAGINVLDGKAGTDIDLNDDVFGVDARADILHRVVAWQLEKRRGPARAARARVTSDDVPEGAAQGYIHGHAVRIQRRSKRSIHAAGERDLRASRSCSTSIVTSLIGS